MCTISHPSFAIDSYFYKRTPVQRILQYIITPFLLLNYEHSPPTKLPIPFHDDHYQHLGYFHQIQLQLVYCSILYKTHLVSHFSIRDKLICFKLALHPFSCINALCQLDSLCVAFEYDVHFSLLLSQLQNWRLSSFAPNHSIVSVAPDGSPRISFSPPLSYLSFKMLTVTMYICTSLIIARALHHEHSHLTQACLHLTVCLLCLIHKFPLLNNLDLVHMHISVETLSYWYKIMMIITYVEHWVSTCSASFICLSFALSSNFKYVGFQASLVPHQRCGTCLELVTVHNTSHCNEVALGELLIIMYISPTCFEPDSYTNNVNGGVLG